MDDVSLARPEGIDEPAWTSITKHRDRLKDALLRSDRPHVLGCAKDLVECVARVVVSELGDITSESDDFPTALGKAHKTLKRQPGIDLTDDPSLQKLAQGAKNIAIAVNEFRNSRGTGHGRVRDPIVEDEVYEASLMGALLWVRWSLRRLEYLIRGMPNSLIRDLSEGAKFYREDLAERLVAASLANLETDTLQRLGKAVGQRAKTGTFNVQEEGVEKCSESSDLMQWPVGYREGLARSMFFSENGRVQVTQWSSEYAAGVISGIPDPESILDEMISILPNVDSSDLNSINDDSIIYKRLIDSKDLFEEPYRSKWIEFAVRFKPSSHPF
ncbi:abortive infection family protein [Halopolyspora algeriensis]|nr:abortive infection family protein [Halopolyspora algeriensis]